MRRAEYRRQPAMLSRIGDHGVGLGLRDHARRCDITNATVLDELRLPRLIETLPIHAIEDIVAPRLYRILAAKPLPLRAD